MDNKMNLEIITPERVVLKEKLAGLKFPEKMENLK